MEIFLSKFLKGGDSGPIEVLNELKLMRSRGVDPESAKNILEMQIFSMAGNCAAMAVLVAPVSLVSIKLGWEVFEQASAYFLLATVSLYLGAGSVYIFEYLKAKRACRGYQVKVFTSLSVFSFSLISLVFSSVIFLIMLLGSS
ncbi:hypothetical protein ACWFMI_10800 [Nocardiopsis terrae]